jgi:hypothetical protein
MLCFFSIFILTIFNSCDNGEYYKSFDYKTMTFIEPTTKSDYCIRKISQTDDKIEMEVFFDVNKIKRTFIKKKNHWYSSYKYETVKVPLTRLTYGDKFEYEYFIFKDYVISKEDYFFIYTDLKNSECSIYNYVSTENLDLSQLDLNTIQDKLSCIESFYSSNDRLFIKRKNYNKGIFSSVTIDERGFSSDLDIFYWMNLEIYYPGVGKKPIYDE